MFRSFCRLVGAAAFAAAAAACGSSTPVTPTPTTPAPTVTDTFNGTLNQNGAFTNPFTAAAGGSVTATLSAIGPDSSMKIGMALGTWNGAACTLVITNDSAGQGSTVGGTINSAGNYCVRIYDVGNVVDPITWTVTVSHP